MFKALARIFGFFSRPKPAPQPLPPAPVRTQPAVRSTVVPDNPGVRRKFGLPDSPAAQPGPEPQPEVENRPAAEDVRAAAEQRSFIDPTASPEEICGIHGDMTQAEISEILARLYQRHNRASSSFDVQLQSEAEFMLDLIAGLREKYLSRPPGGQDIS